MNELEQANQKIANQIWRDLAEAFNAEAEYYIDGKFSPLGSIGALENREVLRAAWWDYLDADKYGGDYDAITWLIESEHDGEQLATGRITFGS